MPAFNVAPFLADAIDSVLSQTEPRFELLVIDDGSTDDTANLAETYVKKDKRISLLRRPHRGLAATRNEALDLARGEFLAPMDGDDISVETRLEKQLAHLLSHPHCVAVG